MNFKRKVIAVAATALSLALAAPMAMAVPDPNVTAATTAAKTAFDDNFGAVATMFVAITVVVAMVVMAVRWFRRAAK